MSWKTWRLQSMPGVSSTPKPRANCCATPPTLVARLSPADHDVTRGNLCIKGRFGFQHVRPKGDQATRSGPV